MLDVHDLPYLTAEVPGIGGQIKMRPEDFRVDEEPLYEACGDGTHVYFRIEKIGLATPRAIHDLARALHRQPREFGYAGMKDANAVTTQIISLEHVDPKRILELSVPRIRVLSVERHTNKLKIGHLKGNRFTIRVRDTLPEREPDVRAMLDVLGRRGVPNYFGPQRFGMRGDTWLIGRALLRGDYPEALAVLLGRCGPSDYGEVRRAREAFDRGEYEAAADVWPYPFNTERRVCRAYAGSGNARKAFKMIDAHMQRFYVSAFQSQLFNQVVSMRLDTLDRLVEGDLAWRHPQGAVFRVEDLAKEQPRCEAFEISPTGPLFGYRMSEPDGDPGRIERDLLAGENMTLDDWREPGQRKIKGGRRPLRFQPHESHVEGGRDEAGDYLQVQFFLESGCYATTVLREICKTPEVLEHFTK
ncbi:MAG: tRNA pseudouridine(13) synthase TruD [Phycisphaerales bacterium]|nr:tRNA pseudouridine(13) synthase TruD [Phycisphaerales bacterium]